jgi:hypothetical protein
MAKEMNWKKENKPDTQQAKQSEMQHQVVMK